MIKQEFLGMYAKYKVVHRPEYRLDDIMNPITFCVDGIFGHGKGTRGPRCDEFIFFDYSKNKTGLFLVERKTKSSDITKVEKQLKGGAKFIQKFMMNNSVISDQDLPFKPIFVSQGITSSTRSKLLKSRVSIGDKTRRVEHIKINETLPRF